MAKAPKNNNREDHEALEYTDIQVMVFFHYVAQREAFKVPTEATIPYFPLRIILVQVDNGRWRQ
jgi:hypothetical protein